MRQDYTNGYAMKPMQYCYILLAGLMLTACSSETKESEKAAICETGALADMQIITLDTGAVKGANCTAKNQEGEWLLTDTPGTVNVKRSPTPLTITCIKTGYLEGVQVLQSISKDKSVVNLISANLLGNPLHMVDNPYEYPASASFTLTPIDLKTVQAPAYTLPN